MWWPGANLDQGTEPHDQVAHSESTSQGTGQWGKMTGQRNSSTRMEIAGFLVALMRYIPVLVATDSQSLIDKANSIIMAIRSRDLNPHWWRTPHTQSYSKP